MSILKKHSSYVAYFDMLGFKTAVLHNTDNACEALTAIRVALDSQSSKVLLKPEKRGKIYVPLDFRKPIHPLKHVRPYIFSDSILLFTLDTSLDDLISLLILSSRLFQQLLVYKVPLRGGIAWGDFFVNEAAHAFCGVPLVRAYELGNNCKWMGLVIDDVVAANYFDGFLEGKQDSTNLLSWEVPQKSGSNQKHWVFNWVSDMIYGIQPPLAEQQLYSVFKELFGVDFDDLQPYVQEIYCNTTTFINANYRKHS